MPRLAHSVENVPHSRIRELGEIALGMAAVTVAEVLEQKLTAGNACGRHIYMDRRGRRLRGLAQLLGLS